MIPRPQYRGGTLGLHRSSPVGSVLLLAGLLVVALGSPSVILKVGALALIALLAWRSGESPRRFLGSLRFVFFFAVLLFVAQLLSVRDGRTLFHVGVPITDTGLLSGASFALRFLVILSASFLFVLVTDPDRLAHAMIRLGIPYRYGFIFILALRFVPFFRDELRTVREAQQLRGIRVTVRSLRGVRRAVRYTFVPVLVAALMRVDSITMSMKGRSFGLFPKRSSAQDLRWSRWDAAAIAIGVGLVALVAVSRRWAWP